jgi:hypothetical protein
VSALPATEQRISLESALCCQYRKSLVTKRSAPGPGSRDVGELAFEGGGEGNSADELHSAEVVVSAASRAWAAPLTTNDAPGSVDAAGEHSGYAST